MWCRNHQRCHSLTRGLAEPHRWEFFISDITGRRRLGRGGEAEGGRWGKNPYKEMCAVYCFAPSTLNNTVNTSSDCPEHEWTGGGGGSGGAAGHLQSCSLGEPGTSSSAAPFFLFFFLFPEWVGVMFDFFRNAPCDQTRQQQQ